MKPKSFCELCERFAPLSISDELCQKYGWYDNSGLLVDCAEEITGALFSLDCSVQAVEEAKKAGANLLVTHHPAIYQPIKGLRSGEANERAVLAAARAGISILSFHLNLDCAEGGIDESLMKGLGGANPQVMQTVLGGGYGRAYAVATDTVGVCELLKREFLAERVTVYGGNRKIKRIASFCGAGLDEGAIAFAREQGADVILSSDAKHHLILQTLECGMGLILPTHYAVERYGFEKFYLKIKGEVDFSCEFFTDERLL